MQHDFTFNFETELNSEEQTGKTYLYFNPSAYRLAQTTTKIYEKQSIVTDTNKMRSIKHKGETFLSSFDFFQKIQRWMYQQGLFNFNAN